MNSNCSNLLDLRNLQEQLKKALSYQKLFWPFTVWINCSSDLKNFENSRLSASNFKSFSRSLEQFFLTVGQNNFGNKIPFLPFSLAPSYCISNFCLCWEMSEKKFLAGLFGLLWNLILNNLWDFKRAILFVRGCRGGVRLL